jgi:hypothetical protein
MIGASTLYDPIATKAGGLHAQRNNIDWYEDYDEPAMRELPEGPMVCVLAGMGIGKTVAIKSTLLKTCKPVTKKALVITHSRSLRSFSKISRSWALSTIKRLQVQSMIARLSCA